MRTPEEARIQKLEERMGDMVHAAELHELADKWRYGDAQAAGQSGQHVAADAIEECADELEEFVDARTGTDTTRMSSKEMIPASEAYRRMDDRALLDSDVRQRIRETARLLSELPD
jgi:hypothetical protein